jgi:MoxR-like ATPase
MQDDIENSNYTIVIKTDKLDSYIRNSDKIGEEVAILQEKENTEIESIFNDPDFLEEPIHHVVYRAVEEGKNIYLKGLSGTGKTKVSSLIAKKLGLPFYRINISNNTMESHFLGEKVLEDGDVVFKYGMLPKAMGASYSQILYKSTTKEKYKLTPLTKEDMESDTLLFDGIDKIRNEKKIKDIDELNIMVKADISRPGLLLIDEYDNGRQEYLFVLQAVLEKDGILTIAENFGEVIPRSNNFRIVASGNTFGRGDDKGLYNRQELDVSQLDRFDSFYEFNYSIREIEILSKYISEQFTKKDLSDVMKFTEKIREMINNGDLKIVFSTRRLISLCDRASKIGFKDSLLYGFYYLLSEEERSSVKEIYSDIFAESLEDGFIQKETERLKKQVVKTHKKSSVLDDPKEIKKVHITKEEIEKDMGKTPIFSGPIAPPKPDTTEEFLEKARKAAKGMKGKLS